MADDRSRGTETPAWAGDPADVGDAVDPVLPTNAVDPTDAGAAERRFRSFFAEAEPRLRHAFVAAYGPDLGAEAAADALAWAWEHFEQLEEMDSRLGYLWRVGQTSVRRRTRRWRRESPWDAWQKGAVSAGAGSEDLPEVEPALVHAVSRLSRRQRVAVLLVHGYGYRLAEVAELQGCSISTVRNHLRRGLASLRSALGVDPTMEVDHG